MADYWYAEITLGGKVKESLVPDLIKKMYDCIGGSEGKFKEDFESIKVRPRPLCYIENEARYGHFEELEDYCRKHNIHYYVKSDGYNEYLPEIRYYEGHKEIIVTANSNGDLIMSKSDITEYIRIIEELCADPKKIPLHINDDKFRYKHTAKYMLRTGQTNPIIILKGIIEERYPEPGNIPDLEIIS